MSKGERIILKDDKGKQYELIRVLDLDTKKIIDDLSALVVKKDKIIDLMANALKFVSINDNNKYIHFNDTESIKKYFEERCK